MSTGSRHTVVEAVLALGAGVAWFTVCSVLLGVVLPHAFVVMVAVVAMAVAVVLALARYWGINYAVSVGIAAVVALDWYYIPPLHPVELPDARNTVALATYLVAAVLLGELAVLARRRALVSERARAALADEQAALRRVATLVAREVSPTEVFSSVTEEVGRLLAIDIATLLRYETDGTGTVVAAWSKSGRHVPVGTRVVLDGDNVAVMVLQQERLARMDGFADAVGPLAGRLREIGVRSSVGSPIVVDGRLWGVMVAASVLEDPIPAGTEARLSEFTELAATAVANAQARAELYLSRTRIVESADQARQQIERNLHDGVQQRLVALALGLRVAEDLASSASSGLMPTLAGLREGMVEALDELRELSHGIHPAILSEGGLRPALGKVSRRSPVPVGVEIHGRDRLPESLEVGIYYVVSEALANVAKHARAAEAHVVVDTGDDAVRVTIRDDGAGGADPRGSGLVGLADRVHALGGTIEINSPIGRGTSIRVAVPLADAAGVDAEPGTTTTTTTTP